MIINYKGAALSLLITSQITDREHFWAAVISGAVAGFGTAFWSRRQAQPDPPSPGTPRRTR